MFGEMAARRSPIAGPAPGAPADAIYVESGAGTRNAGERRASGDAAAGFAGGGAFHRDQPGAARCSSGNRTRPPNGTTASRACPEWHRCCWSRLSFRRFSGAAVHRRDRAPDIRSCPRVLHSTATARCRDSPVRDEPRGKSAPARRARRRRIGRRLRPCSISPGETLQAVRGHRVRSAAHKPGRAGPDRPCRFRGACQSAAVGDVKVTRLVAQANGRAAWDRRSCRRARRCEPRARRRARRRGPAPDRKAIWASCSRSLPSIRPTGRRRRGSNDGSYHGAEAHAARDRSHVPHQTFARLSRISTARGTLRLFWGKVHRSWAWRSEIADERYTFRLAEVCGNWSASPRSARCFAGRDPRERSRALHNIYILGISIVRALVRYGLGAGVRVRRRGAGKIHLTVDTHNHPRAESVSSVATGFRSGRALRF